MCAEFEITPQNLVQKIAHHRKNYYLLCSQFYERPKTLMSSTFAWYGEKIGQKIKTDGLNV